MSLIELIATNCIAFGILQKFIVHHHHHQQHRLKINILRINKKVDFHFV
jgi:hypothetical protein